MAIAAVPKYLGNDFAQSSPGLRFGMYLKLWGVNNRTCEHLWTTADINYRCTGPDQQERRFEDSNKSSALSSAAKLNLQDTRLARNVGSRQESAFRLFPEECGIRLQASSIAPFTTGLGNEHPLENGFAFLNPYGLPYLPGSGVKGVIRRAAEELAHKELFGSNREWTLPTVWQLFGFEPWPKPEDEMDVEEWERWVGGFDVSDIEIECYLKESLGGDSNQFKEIIKDLRSSSQSSYVKALLQRRKLHVRGALLFWDVIPQIKGGELMVEIMTPHQKHYYQDEKSPHDSGSPIPINFLTIPPGTGFTFHVVCDRGRMGKNRARNNSWKTLLKSAFEHAFNWLGFGAKTAVGYGAMRRDRTEEIAAERQRKQDAARRAQEDEERRRQQTQEAEDARRQAEWDQLSEGQKRIKEAERALEEYNRASEARKREIRAEITGKANQLTKDDFDWIDSEERETAAAFLMSFFDTIGWFEPGANRKRRAKTEQRRRAAISKIRGNN